VVATKSRVVVMDHEAGTRTVTEEADPMQVSKQRARWLGLTWRIATRGVGMNGWQQMARSAWAHCSAAPASSCG